MIDKEIAGPGVAITIIANEWHYGTTLRVTACGLRSKERTFLALYSSQDFQKALEDIRGIAASLYPETVGAPACKTCFPPDKE